MRTLDFSPLFRSTVGFDHLARVMDSLAGEQAPAYPPYNIEKLGEDSYRITMAVAGFRPEEIDITTQENKLVIAGRVLKDAKEAEERAFLHRGIAARQFQRAFVLAEGIEGGWLPYASRATDFPQPWNGFTAQGYLEDERGDGEVRYTWTPFSGGGPGADLRMEQLGNDDVPGHPNGGLALDDMLLSTQWLYAPDWEELQAEVGGSWFDVGGVRSVAVQGASWDGTQEWELVVAVPVLSEDGITWPNRAPLLPVPGAVLVVSGGATSVVGLV
jgi:molecular chaperone IbpA